MIAIEVLKKYWGYNTFRPMQEDVIDSLLSKKDTLAIMPTGGGKSICFQVPALMQEGVCLVVSPLIALMNDQVLNLRARGIQSLSVHSGIGFGEVKRRLENAVDGECHFLYVSPERLETGLFLEYLPFLKLNLLAVDEAHCISQWGYDFRPAYLRISALRKYIPEVPVLALTASATKKVQKDICDKLLFKEGYRLFAQTYDRRNLSYSVIIPQAKEKKIAEIFQKVPGTGIAYCATRKRTREVAQLLSASHISADFYHAGLPSRERNDKQEQWISEQIRIICCTNAFGMGIDKPNVRSVVHYDMPDAIEYYYQEAGRAGRDGLKAYAVLLVKQQEITGLRERITLRFPDIKTIREVYAAICSFFQLPAGKGKGLTLQFEMGKFLSSYHFNPVLASSALKILDQEEVFALSDNLFNPSSVEFLTSRQSINAFEKDFPVYNNVLKGLLRSYEGIFEQACFVDEFELARFVKMNKADVIQQLTELDKMQIIEYTPRSDQPRIMFFKDRVPADELIINERNIALRRAAYEERLEAMIQYVTETDECRSVFINRYFGGKPILPCGICDICLSRKRKPLNTAELESVIQYLKNNSVSSYEEIADSTGLGKNKVSEALYFLSQENKIGTNDEGKVMFG